MYSVLATRLVSNPPHAVGVALGILLTLVWPQSVEMSSNPQSTASSLRCRHSAARDPASTRDAATTAASSSPTRQRRLPTQRPAPRATPPTRRPPPPASSPTTTAPNSTMSTYRPPRRYPSQRRKNAPASTDFLFCNPHTDCCNIPLVVPQHCFWQNDHMRPDAEQALSVQALVKSGQDAVYIVCRGARETGTKPEARGVGSDRE